MANSKVLDDNMEDKILKYIEEHPTGTWTEQISRDLTMNRATAKNYIVRLEALGKVKMEKRGQMKVIFPI